MRDRETSGLPSDLLTTRQGALAEINLLAAAGAEMRFVEFI
jgi:hypothetical protein